MTLPTKLPLPSRIVRAGVVALVASVSLTLPVGAQSAPQSAAVDNIRYDVTFDRETARRRMVRIVTSFDVGGPGVVLLSLPSWTPGAYEISNFARRVEDFEAKDADGKPLRWDKLDFDSWRIQPGPGGTKSMKVAFSYVADSLDNAMSWSRPDFLLFNGTNLFLYPEGRSLDFHSRVTLHTEAEWRVATGMRSEAPSGGPTHDFTAPNYHDLVDMPFFVGRFDIDSAQIVGHWVRLATYPTGSVSGAARTTAWDQLKRVIPPQVAVFAEVPWDTYTVMQIADSSYQGASGLEHQNSHVDVLTPLAIGSEFQPSLYAHEIFHAWNVKRLRPADLWPYTYDRAQPTPWLWVSEGITDYYADLAEVRGGVVDERGFYALTGAKMKEVGDTRPVALEDASVDTWIHPVDGTQYTYYPKGSLVGLMIDIMIRDASDNKKSLDQVMRDLYQSTYKAGRGFTATDWWSAVSRAANGKSFDDVAVRYVDGREPLPWDRVLPLAGLIASRPKEPRLGVYTMPDPSAGNRVVVTRVEPGTSAAEAGVREGDYLLAIGDIPVTDQRFAERFRAKFGSSAEGSPMLISVRRGADSLALPGKLRFVPGDVRLEADAKASAKAVRIRNGILKGRTDP